MANTPLKKYSIVLDTNSGENKIEIISDNFIDVLDKIKGIVEVLNSEVSFISILIQEQS
jgi:hypothetical protein